MRLSPSGNIAWGVNGCHGSSLQATVAGRLWNGSSEALVGQTLFTVNTGHFTDSPCLREFLV
jgi:hypothetical protein